MNIAATHPPPTTTNQRPLFTPTHPPLRSSLSPISLVTTTQRPSRSSATAFRRLATQRSRATPRATSRPTKATMRAQLLARLSPSSWRGAFKVSSWWSHSPPPTGRPAATFGRLWFGRQRPSSCAFPHLDYTRHLRWRLLVYEEGRGARQGCPHAASAAGHRAGMAAQLVNNGKINPPRCPLRPTELGELAYLRLMARLLTTEHSPGRLASATCIPPVPASPQKMRGFPPLWTNRAAAVDPSSGRTYYVNSATGQSQWEPPV